MRDVSLQEPVVASAEISNMGRFRVIRYLSMTESGIGFMMACIPNSNTTRLLGHGCYIYCAI